MYLLVFNRFLHFKLTCYSSAKETCIFVKRNLYIVNSGMSTLTCVMSHVKCDMPKLTLQSQLVQCFWQLQDSQSFGFSLLFLTRLHLQQQCKHQNISTSSDTLSNPQFSIFKKSKYISEILGQCAACAAGLKSENVNF